MDLKWVALSWIGRQYSVDEETLSCMQKNYIVLQNGLSTLVLHRSNSSCVELTAKFTENQEETKALFACQGETYSLSGKQLLRLHVKEDPSLQSDFFAINTASESDAVTWKKLSGEVDGVLATTEVSDGFAAIVKCRTHFYINTYRISEETSSLRSDVRLLLPGLRSLGTKWHLSRLKTNQLPLLYLQNLFKKPVIADDIIVIGLRNGSVYLYSENLPPVLILSHIDDILAVKICKNWLVFVSSQGQIVFYSVEKSLSVTRFLPTKAVCATVIEKENGVVIVWSDGDFVFHTSVVNETFEISVFKTELTGIFKFFEFEDVLLACNLYGNVYKILLNETETPLRPFVSDLQPFSSLGSGLKSLQEQYEALMCEQIDSSLLSVSVVGFDLELCNKSERTFSKNVWKLKCRYSDGNHHTKEFLFDNDLKPNDTLKFSLSNFGSVKHSLHLSLVGLLSPKTRLLKIDLGSFQLSN